MGPDEEGYKGYSIVSQMTNKRDEMASGLLEDVASYLIVFTHSCVEKMTYLPFPVGAIIKAVEERVVPLAQPVEGLALHFLASVDDQIYAVGTSIQGCVLCASGKLNLILTRGPIGMTADFWAQHEALMKEKMQTMIDLASKIPLVGLFAPFVCTLSAPLARTFSDLLVGHSQSQGRRIQFQRKNIQSGKESLGELQERPEDWSMHVTEIMEAKDVKEEDTGSPVDATLPKDVVGVAAGEEKRGAQEHRVGKVTHDDKENDANDVSAVLDMIDSGWLLGSPRADSPKTSAAAAPKMAASAAAAPRNSKKKSRRGILRH